jgi:hypothetical protein
MLDSKLPTPSTRFPQLHVDFLEEVEVLSEYVLRMNMLGWDGRHQEQYSRLKLISGLK